jgi:Ca2+-transporting ATPase
MLKKGDVESVPETWSLSLDATLRQFGATLEGLTGAEAATRLERDGLNRLAQKRPRPAWKKFLDQFRNLLVVVLIGAAILAGAVGDVTDVVVILGVVLFNASLGFYQEHRAEVTLAALKNMLAQQARVRRAGVVCEIAATDLVVGDVVLLDAGDRVPADGRAVAAHDAEVAAAALTGESQAVSKNAAALPAGARPLAERSNMLFSYSRWR